MKFREDYTEPESTPAIYTWGVFKGAGTPNSPSYYANHYSKEHEGEPYPSLVKGNLSREEAQKLAASLKAKKESRLRESGSDCENCHHPREEHPGGGRCEVYADDDESFLRGSCNCKKFEKEENSDEESTMRIVNRIVESLLRETPETLNERNYVDTGTPMSKAHEKLLGYFEGPATKFICKNCGAHCKNDTKCPACGKSDIELDYEYPGYRGSKHSD